MKILVLIFWIITQCELVGRCQRFGGTKCFLLHGVKVRTLTPIIIHSSNIIGEAKWLKNFRFSNLILKHVWEDSINMYRTFLIMSCAWVFYFLYSLLCRIEPFSVWFIFIVIIIIILIILAIKIAGNKELSIQKCIFVKRRKTVGLLDVSEALYLLRKFCGNYILNYF